MLEISSVSDRKNSALAKKSRTHYIHGKYLVSFCIPTKMINDIKKEKCKHVF